MSTRGTIQRMTPDGPIGTYHHWDSYPTALGTTLWNLYHGHFGGDLGKMLACLVDEHEAGWSTINNGDFTKEPGYNRGDAPACYCHGDRSEDGTRFPLAQAARMGCEYAYVFFPEERHLKVLSSYSDGLKMIGMFGAGDPNAEWRVIADLDLNGPEPAWESLD